MDLSELDGLRRRRQVLENELKSVAAGIHAIDVLLELHGDDSQGLSGWSATIASWARTSDKEEITTSDVREAFPALSPSAAANVLGRLCELQVLEFVGLRGKGLRSGKRYRRLPT